MSRSIDDLIDAARARYERVTVEELTDGSLRDPLLVDTRPLEQRERDGEIPGAVIIDRNVLEWRLDPQSEHRIPQTSHDRKIVLFCSEGYASSLAAATLCELGLDATDLIGGYKAWRAGLQ